MVTSAVFHYGEHQTIYNVVIYIIITLFYASSILVAIHCKNKVVISAINPNCYFSCHIKLINSLSPIYMNFWIINSSIIELLIPASLSQCEYHNNFVCSSF